MTTTTTKKPRGFAAMPKEDVSAIAQKGGKAAHRAGTAHKWDSAQAREAGKKGGQTTHARRNGTQVPAPTKKEDDMVVDVACSSAGGCAGTVKAGSSEAAEAIGAPYRKGAKGKRDIADNGPSADENPDDMSGGHCGSGGCGSSK